MVKKATFQYRQSDGHMIIALIDSKRWFKECSFEELPEEIKIFIKESIETTKILESLLD